VDIVLAQLLLAPEAQVQPVTRHVQVLGAEASAAAEAPRGPSRRHGEAPRGPAGFRRGSFRLHPQPREVWPQRPRGCCKFLRLKENEDALLQKTVGARRKMLPGHTVGQRRPWQRVRGLLVSPQFPYREALTSGRTLLTGELIHTLVRREAGMQNRYALFC
jgi:hypothetical protein